jgi:molybdopterin synthase sulfur carrier subunit
MARVFIPSQWRDLTGGVADVEIEASSLGQIIDGLEARFPGLSARACEGHAIAGSLAVLVDGDLVSRGMRSPVQPTSEVHFLPAIGGG